jgi:hypothetical protein
LEKEYPKNCFCKGTLDKTNEGKTRAEIKKLNISNKNLEGELDLTSFKSLQELDCCINKITSLNVEKLDKLEKLNCNRNEITFLKVNHSIALKKLNCGVNKINKLNLSDNINLESLKCHDNPLERINGLHKLKELKEFISNSYSPINQLRDDVKNSFLTGDNGYYDLLNEEVKVFQNIINAQSEDISQKKKNQAQQIKDVYEHKIELINP